MRWPALALLVSVLPLPGSAKASPLPTASRSVITHGFRITIDVPGGAFPRNDLIIATLSIKNASRHAISIMSGLNSPEMAVLDAGGKVVYDPREPLGRLTLISPLGPGPESFWLPAGKSKTVHDYLILRGNTVATRIMLGDYRHPVPLVLITRPQLALPLTREPGPQVNLSAPPLKAWLNLISRPASRIVYYTQKRCGDEVMGAGWVFGRRGVVVGGGGAGCTRFVWHAIAGWLNHPVATIAYTATPKRMTLSTTRPPKLEPADGNFPAAGICARADGRIALVQINIDTPSPRCEIVKPEQGLRVINKTGRAARVRLAHMSVQLRPGQALTLEQPFLTYLARGVHDVRISAYSGGGAELWLRS